MTIQTVSAEQCFSWAHDITYCPDYLTLTPVFISLLHTLEWVHTADAYEIYDTSKTKFTTDIDSLQLHITKLPLDFGNDENTNNHPPALNNPLPKTIEITHENGLHHAILPVATDSGPDRAILVKGLFNDDAVTLLSHLLKLYRNQVILHDHKERDVLTNLPNRQSLEMRLMEVCDYYQRNKHTQFEASEQLKYSWIAVLDIDNFKRVNDNFGHLYGDEVLLHFSQLMQRKFRHIDFLFRYGGEEFVVILNRVNATDARTVFDRFRSAVETYNFPLVGKVTVSIGVTCIQGSTILPMTLLDRADKSLYYAKEHGRNQVVMYEDMEIIAEDTDNDLNDIELF